VCHFISSISICLQHSGVASCGFVEETERHRTHTPCFAHPHKPTVLTPAPSHPCRRKGGNVFNADSIKPPVRWPKVFALCPHSLPSDAEASLMLGDASFRVVHPSCRVTLHWLELCVKVGMAAAGWALQRRRYCRQRQEPLATASGVTHMPFLWDLVCLFGSQTGV
jgi:hypothetical protein